MNEIINKFFYSTYSTCGPLTKNKEQIKIERNDRFKVQL